MESAARLGKAIDKLMWLRDAVKPYSQTAYRTLKDVVEILETERTAAIARRVQAGKQI